MKKIKEFFLINIFLRTKAIIFLIVAAIMALIAALLLTECFLPNLGGEQDAFLDIGPKWSPDGTKIVFVEPTSYRLESNWGIIWVMNADGTSKVKLTSDSEKFNSPVWSPDGTKILFRSGPMDLQLPDRKGDIWIMNADGSNKINLTNSPSQYRSPAWSPDGGKIAFASQQNENEIDIFVMNADGSNKINLTGY